MVVTSLAFRESGRRMRLRRVSLPERLVRLVRGRWLLQDEMEEGAGSDGKGGFPV